jgi:hypothetical protein
MTSYDVRCTRKDGPEITGLGGVGWSHTTEEVIANIGRGDSYWVNAGKRVQVILQTHPKTRRLYLSTEPDGMRQNNLLFLRDCR